MIKGKFKYDNKTFRWKFKIEKLGFGVVKIYANYTTKILYKNKTTLSVQIDSFDNSYKDIILEYDSKSYEEIKSEVEQSIIKDYKKKQKDDEFRKIEMKFK